MLHSLPLPSRCLCLMGLSLRFFYGGDPRGLYKTISHSHFLFHNLTRNSTNLQNQQNPQISTLQCRHPHRLLDGTQMRLAWKVPAFD